LNKREDFRADMKNYRCDIYDEFQSTTGEILNLSGTGAAIEVNVDFLKPDIILDFEITDKRFKRKGEILNRTEMVTGKVKYHIKFIEFTEKERVELHSSLITYEANKINPNN
jgi:hypothetical protein